MLNTKKLFTGILFSFVSVFAFSQTENDEYYTGDKSKLKLSALDRVSGSICAGVGVGASLNNTTSPSSFSYIAPKINYAINDRFRFNLGWMHYSTLGNYRNEGCFPTKQNLNGDLLMIGGEYMLNKKWIASGAVMSDINTLGRKNNFKAVTMELDYKMSNHASIGIRATVSQGNPDYMFNPARNSFDYNPMSNPTGGLFGGLGQWSTDAFNGSIR